MLKKNPSPVRPHGEPKKAGTLAALDDGAEAMIIKIDDESIVAAKLEAMGLGPGRVVRKRSSAPLNGPIVLEFVGGAQMALGSSLAGKIMVHAIPDALDA
jgi:Fe2+ transport system protein FeoA